MKNKKFPLSLSIIIILINVLVSNIIALPEIDVKTDIQQYATGAIWESYDEMIQRGAIEHVANSKNATITASIPSSFDITATSNSNSIYFPAIGNQGQMGACTAWATTYYQFTYEVNKFRNITTVPNIRGSSGNSNVYSPSWTYNYGNGGNNVGIDFGVAYDVLKLQGAMKLADYPYSTNPSTYNYTWSNNIAKMREALDFRAQETITLVQSSTDTRINDVKEQISNGHVAVIYTNANGWRIETNASGQKVIVRGSYTNEDTGGHAMTVVGYDDNFTVTVNGTTLKGAFKLANSWGTSATNHNNGFIWVSYDALNSTSGSWQSNTGRSPIFGDYNIFHFITVKKCNVNFVGQITFTTNYRNSINNIWAAPSKTPTSSQTRFRNPSANTNAVTHNGTVVFDYFDSNITSPAPYLTSDWSVRLASSQSVTNISYLITDNLGKVLPVTFTSASSLTNGVYQPYNSMKLSKGHVLYGTTVTDADVQLVVDYVVNNKIPSNLQFYLADYDDDGVLTVADVINIMYLQNGNGFLLTDTIEGLGYSVADIIEQNLEISLEEYVETNYNELNSLGVIPEQMRS